MAAISSRSDQDKYRPTGPATRVGFTPPASPKVRLPPVTDIPAASAAASTLRPARTPTQNRRSTTFGCLGRPVMTTTPHIEVLHHYLEPKGELATESSRTIRIAPR